MIRRTPLYTAAAAVTLTLLLAYAFIRSGARRWEAEHRVKAIEMAGTLASALQRQLEDVASSVDGVAAELSGLGRLDAFRAVGMAAADRGTPIERLFLISDGQVKDRYPTREEPLQPGDLASTNWETGDGAELRSAAPELLGPVQLSSGEWAVFVRQRLFLTHGSGTSQPAGWVVALVQVSRLLHALDLDRVATSGFDYQLWTVDSGRAQQRLIARSTDFELNSPIKQVMVTSPGRWILFLAPRNGWIPWRPILLESVLVSILALLSGVVTYDYAKRPQRFRQVIEQTHQRLTKANRRLMEEVEQRAELEKQFSHASFHDALTGLPNRRYFMDRLERGLRRVRQQPGFLLAVIVLNFDRFKNINEGLGYAAGDELLLQAVHRFENCLRPYDLIVAHLGGDEFAVLLFDIGNPETAATVAQRLQKALEEPFNIEHQKVFTTASMGIALSSSGYERADELVCGADIALSKAKSEGLGHYSVFDPATREQIVTLQQLESDLHRAVERREFIVKFEPVVSLETRRLTGMETLVRWNHPLEGIIPPAKFIGLAEQTGLIVPIDRWVMRQACLQARAWCEKFPSDIQFYLSANLSAQDLAQPDLCDYVAAVLEETKLPTGVLGLEVTEGVMIGNVKAASELVSRLRELGVLLLLDDFGTGYSSLSYLNRFKFDFVKIDRAFVSRITATGPITGIVRAIVHLAKDLEMKTIAEGVETAEGLEQLHALGCDYAQGWYFSKPMMAEVAEKLFLSRARW